MKAAELIECATDLPIVPEAGLRLLQMLGNPESNLEEILRVVECDPVLSAKLLKTCNSAGFGMRGPVGSIRQAIFYIGYGHAQRLATALSFDSALSRSIPCYNLDGPEFWSHSLMTAHVAEIIASQANTIVSDASVAFTAGLLHDIGKLVMDKALTQKAVNEVQSLVREQGLSEAEAERAVLGTDHGEVGARLLETWELPWYLVRAVACHHAPVYRPQPTLSVLVYAANCIAHSLIAGTNGEVRDVIMDAECAESVGFNEAQWQEVIRAAQEKRESVKQYFSMA